MAEHFKIDDLLTLNPQIDKEELETIQRTLKLLRSRRRTKHGYSLVPPFARPRVTVGEGDKTDPRTITTRYTKR